MTKDAPFLPYARQLIEEDDVAAVVAMLTGDWLTTGPAVAAFEAALAQQTGAHHAVACSSGTAALHLTMLAGGLGPGDHAIVPTVTFLSTANAARFVGAEIVFADVSPDTGLMTETTLRDGLARAPETGRTAILPVHLAGQMVDMEMVAAIAEERNALVVEDACHALGSEMTDANDEATTSGDCRHSDMTVFSFHAVKTAAMGEGGAVTTNDAERAAALRRFRNHGMVHEADAFDQSAFAFAADGSVNPWYYEMAIPGFNYRVTDIQCALGLSQLTKLDRFVARRRELVAAYDVALAPLSPIVRPVGRVANCTPAWHLYPVLIDFATAGLDRATVMNRLRGAGIGTQVHYIPLHMQPYYRKLYGAQSLPGAEEYYARTLSLPLFPAMADGGVDRVVAALAAALSAEPR